VRVFPVLFSLCPCTTREREKRRAGYDDGRAARPSLLLSNKAKTKKKKKKKKVRALELWRARDNGLRLL
jgi:hypothetical protein